MFCEQLEKISRYCKKIDKGKKRGFTLTELLVVMFIISILASLIFLGGATLIKQSRISLTMSTLKNYGYYTEDMMYSYPDLQYNKSDYLKENITIDENKNVLVENEGGNKKTISILNNKFLTSDLHLANGVPSEWFKKDAWDSPYLYQYSMGEDIKNGIKVACVVISSPGQNEINESNNLVSDILKDNHLSASDIASLIDKDELGKTNDDYGVICYMNNSQVSVGYYGFEKNINTEKNTEIDKVDESKDPTKSEETNNPTKEETDESQLTDKEKTEIEENNKEIEDNENIDKIAENNNMSVNMLKYALKLNAMANTVNPPSSQIDSTPREKEGTFSYKVTSMIPNYESIYSWAICYDTIADRVNYIVLYDGDIKECKLNTVYDVYIVKFTDNKGEYIADAEKAEVSTGMCQIRISNEFPNYFKNGYYVFNFETLNFNLQKPDDDNIKMINFQDINEIGTNAEYINDAIISVAKKALQTGQSISGFTKIDSVSTTGYWYGRLLETLSYEDIYINTNKLWKLEIQNGELKTIYFTKYDNVKVNSAVEMYKYSVNSKTLETGTSYINNKKIINETTFKSK